jgi:hypothetical protein
MSCERACGWSLIESKLNEIFRHLRHRASPFASPPQRKYCCTKFWATGVSSRNW